MLSEPVNSSMRSVAMPAAEIESKPIKTNSCFTVTPRAFDVFHIDCESPGFCNGRPCATIHSHPRNARHVSGHVSVNGTLGPTARNSRSNLGLRRVGR